ncbi:MAG: helix-turn-helix transcriptional regulator [Lewinellaceae bacterium]|nr:helix-turn-helix transcriptional regulator [Lewinellaceae bacterium]
MSNPPCPPSPFVRTNLSDDLPNLSSEKSLTLREREIIQWMSHDQNVKKIARSLNISAFTVQDHIKNIKCKMDMHTPGGIVAKAIREGLIE